MKPQMFSKSALNSLLTDRTVMDQVGGLLGSERVTKLTDELNLSGSGLKAIVEAPRAEQGEFSGEEAIVLAMGRPPLIVHGDAWEPAPIPEINRRLESARAGLTKAIGSVARLEVPNHESLPYLGTAWMIAEEVMITNRHVVEAFAYRAGGNVRFLSTPLGQEYCPQVDFREEYEVQDAFEVPIREVLYLESRAPGLPDLAFVRVERHPKLPPPIELDPIAPGFHDDIAVIGYPAADSGRNDSLVMQRLFAGIYDVKRLSPGWIIGVDLQVGLVEHDCTTLGGSSGSVLVSLNSGKAVGLHFMGEYRRSNYAIPATTVTSRLRALSGQGVFLSARPAGAPASAGFERPKPKKDNLADRDGYDSGFLAKSVDLPQVGPHLEGEVVAVPGSHNGLLHYLHFSIAMHRSRRMALYTACNIDGEREFAIKRTGSDPWAFDPRLGEEFQIGHTLYAGANLQRGHLVRRLDPCWGNSRGVAKLAEQDTFYFTNCTPQHENFNPKTWLSLEEYVLQNAWAQDLKVSVFTGPVFRDTDKTFRDARIPEEYWKIIATVREDTQDLSATGYIVSQADWLNDLEFAYGPFETYQVPLKVIERRTGLGFAHLRPYDPFDQIEARVIRLIKRPEDIQF